MTGPDAAGLAAAIAAGDAERAAVRERLASRRATLPLRYWRQQAHLTTPAADAAMARKAVEGGTAPVSRMLERLGLNAADLAECLEQPADVVEARLATARRAPLVMLDGEDAIAPTDEAAARGLAVAADTFATADWGDGRAASLRFFRPPGFDSRDGGARPPDPAVAAPPARAGRRSPAARRDRLPQDRASRGGRPAPRPARAGGGGPRAGRRLHPGGLPGRERLGGSPAAGHRATRRVTAGRPHLRAGRLQRRSGPAGHRRSAPARRLGSGGDRRRRRGGRRAGHRRHDPGLPGGRPGARRRRQPDALARPHAPRLR